ncbi:SDR family oxidoreductase [Sinirhodobacter populi]|uniref:SDR family oxidoreductase n=2 Tax=Paenirhodobacter populi TaxID=2306993 RepID=A0A443J9K8_9RHOB|nr:SDR family oxidoreductase [Sinirhodobacter populi]RWR17183.1 SDR family oxidoreductase [Sinirhodobacter populi]
MTLPVAAQGARESDAEQQKPLTGKIAIVTGGSRGIGRRIAERLAQEGCRVVLVYLSNTAAANEAVAAISQQGGVARAEKADVADEKAIAAVFQRTQQDFGGIDFVVNAAGILPVSSISEVSLAEADRVFQTNLWGTLVVDQQAARTVRAGGSIINISSAITRQLVPGYGAYAASKAGVEALTVVLARELGGQDITVNAVAPGPTDTQMLNQTLESSGNAEQMRQALISAIPLGRIGRTDDIASIVLALIGPNRWVHGQVIHTNGGIA